MPPTLRTGKPQAHRSHGYTFVELLVVLSILAGIAVLATPVLSGLSGPRLDRHAATVGEVLRAARSRAIGENREVVVAIDTAAGIISDATGSERLRLPPGIEIGLVTAGAERIGAATGGIRFYPDGSATGGAVTLAREGLGAIVEVDWFDGSVEVRRGAL